MSSPVLRLPLSRWNKRRLAVRSPMRRRLRLELERLEDRLEMTGPTITSLSPNTGPPAGGTDVTIGGTNFTNVQAVFFGANQATNVTVVSPITIEATSPAGTGVVNVTVRTSAGTSPITSADEFTYQTSTLPTVTSVNPDNGPVAGGTPVTITGTNFTGVTAVNFGTTAATNVTVVSSTTIDATSPAVSGPGPVDVTVMATGGTSPINRPGDVFTYTTASSPTVTGVNPNSGPVAGGTPVTITGTNFTGATAVDFGTTAATSFSVVNSTTIDATSPAAAGPGPADVIVTTSAGTSPINRPGDVFTYIAAPTVTNINPNSGPVAGGTPVTITGTNFTGATTVDFGTIPVASFTVNGAGTQITTASPAAAGPGPVDVTVMTPSGTSPITPTDVFTYVAAAPSVFGLNPNSGPTTGGTTVTITGTGFSGATAVNFGTTPAASFAVTSSTTITAVSPPGTGGVDVTVTTPQGTSATSPADVFTYFQYPPTVTGISPRTGATGGGTPVTITGTGFISPTGTVTVFFGPNQATNVKVVSATTITAVSPPGTGSVDVMVYVNDVGSATNPADVFTYTMSVERPARRPRGPIRLPHAVYLLRDQIRHAARPNLGTARLELLGRPVRDRRGDRSNRPGQVSHLQPGERRGDPGVLPPAAFAQALPADDQRDDPFRGQEPERPAPRRGRHRSAGEQLRHHGLAVQPGGASRQAARRERAPGRRQGLARSRRPDPSPQAPIPAEAAGA